MGRLMTELTWRMPLRAYTDDDVDRVRRDLPGYRLAAYHPWYKTYNPTVPSAWTMMYMRRIDGKMVRGAGRFVLVSYDGKGYEQQPLPYDAYVYCDLRLKLRDWRCTRLITQQSMAHMLGISIQMLRLLEYQERELTDEMRARIYVATGLMEVWGPWPSPSMYGL